MRRRIDSLNELIPRIRSDRAEGGSLEGAVLPQRGTSVAEGRRQLRDEVVGARDATEQRLADVVAALETIRLGLLRMHAGSTDLERLTTDLHAARHVGEDVEDLFEAQREVEALLEGRTDETV